MSPKYYSDTQVPPHFCLHLLKCMSSFSGFEYFKTSAFFWVLRISNSIYLVNYDVYSIFLLFYSWKTWGTKCSYTLMQCPRLCVWWSIYPTGWISQNPGLSTGYTNTLNVCGYLAPLCYLHTHLSLCTFLLHTFTQHNYFLLKELPDHQNHLNATQYATWYF